MKRTPENDPTGPPYEHPRREVLPAARRVARHSWESFDEMATAIHDAKVRAFITGRQTRHWTLDAWSAGSSLVQRAVEGAAVSGSGTLDEGRIGYFLTGERSASRRCNGEELDAGKAFRWGPGAEISSLSRRSTEWIALTVTPEAARHAGSVLEGEPATERPVEPGTSGAPPPDVTAFRRLLEGAMRAMDDAGPAGLHPEAARNLEESLALAGARLFAPRDRAGAARGRLAFDRARVLSRVEEFLAAAGSEPVYVTALCERLGLSERTLRYVFEEQFGASPIRILRSRRLCEVRGALRAAPPGARVSEIAGRFGFWHLGQFATDYRNLFGERPSETLRRARSRPASGRGPEPGGLAAWAEGSGRLA